MCPDQTGTEFYTGVVKLRGSTFNTAEQESTKAAPFVVIFTFRTGSQSINQWKINELLPEKCNKRVLKQRWTAFKQNLFKSQVNMANRYNRNRVSQPFKVGDLTTGIIRLTTPVGRSPLNCCTAGRAPLRLKVS